MALRAIKIRLKIIIIEIERKVEKESNTLYRGLYCLKIIRNIKITIRSEKIHVLGGTLIYSKITYLGCSEYVQKDIIIIYIIIQKVKRNTGKITGIIIMQLTKFCFLLSEHV